MNNPSLSILCLWMTLYIDSVFGQVVTPLDTPSTGECGGDEIRCPTSLACFKDYQICDSYNDCGTGFDEIECMYTPRICDEVKANSTAFLEACTMNTMEGIGDSDQSNPGTLFFVGFTSQHVIDVVLVDPSFLQVFEFGFLKLIITPYSFRSKATLDPVTIVASDGIPWVGETGFRHPIPLRMPIIMNPPESDSIQLNVSLVADAFPSDSNPYQAPTFLPPQSFWLRLRSFHGDCAGFYEEDGSSPSGRNPCLDAARSYAVVTNDAARIGVSCEPRERIQTVYNIYQQCYESPLPVQPWQQTPSNMSRTEMPTTRIPSTTSAVTEPPEAPTTMTTLFAPPCGNRSLVCPVSFGCYSHDRVCDFFNDCGTDFDESLCRFTSEEDVVCNDVRTNATVFEGSCIRARLSSSPRDFNGVNEYRYFTPVAPGLYIDSITVDVTPSNANLPGTIYAMFNITTTNIETAVLTTELQVTPKGTITSTIPLRGPIPVASDQLAIRISGLQTLQSDIPPGPLNPYREAFVNIQSVQVNYVRFLDYECTTSSPEEQNLCLQTALNVRNATQRASALGLNCLPPERTSLISSLIDHCFEAPSIIFITGNMTVPPGREVQLLCAATGSQATPQVHWIIPASLSAETQSYQVLSLGFAELNFTSIAGTNYRFECVAENYLGQARAISTVVTLDVDCELMLDTRDRLLAESNVSRACPAVQEIDLIFYDFRQEVFVYQPYSSGLLHSVHLPLYIFSSEYDGGLLPALRISVTVDVLTDIPQRRRRRDIIPLLSDNVYFDIKEDRDNRAYAVYFNEPVQIHAFENLYISVTSLNRSVVVSPPDGPVPLRYLECTSVLQERAHEPQCYGLYGDWQRLEEELIQKKCANDTSPLFKLYQNCLRFTSEPLREYSLALPEFKLYGNYTLRCQISGSVQSHWMRRTSRGDVTPFRLPSSVLGFSRFNSYDQGYYYCRGIGEENQTLISEPMLLAVQDDNITTLVFSITYDTPFIDFTSPGFNLLVFQAPVRTALLADPAIAQSMVGGAYGLGGFDLPLVVNTRNGSTIVDYQASFASEHELEDLTELVTTVLQTNLRNSDATPSFLILDSITVGSLSSCAGSVYTGNEGTLTFPTIGLGQTAESLEHCAIYTGNTPLPRATRRCIGDFISPASWADPVLSDCFNDDETTDQILSDIADTTVTSENVMQYSSDLAIVTNQTSSITAEGLDSIATSLENIIQVGDSSEEVTTNVIHAVNDVLRVMEDEFLMAVGVEAPTRILDSFEDQITIFQTQGQGSNLTVVDDNVAVVAVSIPDSSLRQGLGFATQGGVGDDDMDAYNDVLSKNTTMLFFNVDEIPVNEFEASVLIPSGRILGSIADDSADGMVPVTFFVFQNNRLFLSTDQVNNKDGGHRQVVGSRIISATIEGFDVHNLPLGEEIETAFLELNVTNDGESVDMRSCVFWEKTATGGRWSTEGCRREDIPGLGRIRCLCNHLTSFAVLLDVSGDINIYALDILSLIGCGISTLCLVILIVTFLSVKKLRSRQPQRIHINLCLALLGLYISFMIGIDLRYPTTGCIIAGFILHFFLLASMAWMLVEAVYMYLLFVSIHSGTVSKFLRSSSVLAWGSPLTVCIVLVYIDTTFYLGDDTYCFVQPGLALYFSVFLPIAFILLINIVIFVLVTYRLTCGRWAISANKSGTDSHSKKRSETWRLLQDLVAFTILLGLTWVFGFLAIGGARFIFNLLFLIFNSLQGLFVFIMFGLRQKPVRDEWLRCLCCRCGESDRDRRSNQYIKSKPTKGQSSSGGPTDSTNVSDIPLNGRSTLS